MVTVALPGGRDVRATFDRARTDDTGGENSDTTPAPIGIVCPPDPRRGGSRHQPLLRAVSNQLTAHGIDCLRFEYGPWDEGRGETRDAEAACNWARERTSRVGLVGYSFGGAVALQAAARADIVEGLSVIAPPDALLNGVETADNIANVTCTGQVIYGTRDTTVDWRVVLSAATNHGFETVAIDADHHFAGQTARVVDAVSEFFGRCLG